MTDKAKWRLAIVAILLLLFYAIDRDVSAPILAGASLATVLIVIMVAVVLLWFVYRMCLAPRIKLKRLQRIRVKQGRRHPLA